MQTESVCPNTYTLTCSPRGHRHISRAHGYTKLGYSCLNGSPMLLAGGGPLQPPNRVIPPDPWLLVLAWDVQGGARRCLVPLALRLSHRGFPGILMAGLGWWVVDALPWCMWAPGVTLGAQPPSGPGAQGQAAAGHMSGLTVSPRALGWARKPTRLPAFAQGPHSLALRAQSSQCVELRPLLERLDCRSGVGGGEGPVTRLCAGSGLVTPWAHGTCQGLPKLTVCRMVAWWNARPFCQ